MSGISNYLEAKILDQIFTNATFPAISAVWGSLHTGDPTESGTGSPLASCPRVQLFFNAAASATTVNSTAASWDSSASGTVTHIGLWDASATATANFLWGGELSTSKIVNPGDTVTLASGSLAITLD